MALTGI